jgi:hypothetical protein
MKTNKVGLVVLLVIAALSMKALAIGLLMRRLRSSLRNRFINFFANVPGTVIPGTIAPGTCSRPLSPVEDRKYLRLLLNPGLLWYIGLVIP